MQKFLGLALTKDNILASEVAIVKNKTKILKIKTQPLTYNSQKDYELKIKGFLKKGKFKTKITSYAIPDEDVIIRVNDYPKMPLEDLKKIILDEVSNFKIFEGDYPVLNIVKLKDLENRIRYLVTLTPRKRVEERVRFLKKFGLEVKNIDIESISAFRGVKVFNKETLSQAGVFIFLGEFKTTLIFFEDGNPLLFRDFDIGVKNFDENTTLFNSEILNTISYFSREEKKDILKIIVTSIYSNIEPIAEKIGSFLGIKTQIVKPFQERETNLNLPLGLSLFNLEDKIKINLVPKDILERRKDEYKLFFLTLFSIILGFLIIFLSIYLISSIQATKNSLIQTKENLKRVEGSIEDLKEIERSYSENKKLVDRIKGVVQNFEYHKIYEDLVKIANLKPQDINLLNIIKTKDNEYSIDLTSSSLSSIYSYKDSLIKNGFKKINIEFIKNDGTNLYSAKFYLFGGESE